MKTTIAYTESQSIIVPEVKFNKIPQGCHAVALRGYGYTKAVMQGNKCIGWIQC